MDIVDFEARKAMTTPSEQLPVGSIARAVQMEIGEFAATLEPLILERFSAPPATVERRDAEVEFWNRLEELYYNTARAISRRAA